MEVADTKILKLEEFDEIIRSNGTLEITKDLDEQEQLMDGLLKQGLFGKLAQVLLLRDSIHNRFQFLADVSFSNSVDRMLREQKDERMIAIFSLTKQLITLSSQNGEAQLEINDRKSTILEFIKKEMAFLEGIETILNAALKRCTMSALKIQAECNLNRYKQTYYGDFRENELPELDAIQRKILTDVKKRERILITLRFILQTDLMQRLKTQ